MLSQLTVSGSHDGTDEPRRPVHQHGGRGLERASKLAFEAVAARILVHNPGLVAGGGRRLTPLGDGRQNTDRVDGISNTVHPLGHSWPFDRACAVTDCF